MANLEQRLRIRLPEPCDELQRRSGDFSRLGREHILWKQRGGHSWGFHCVVSRVERCRRRQYSDPLRGLLQRGTQYAKLAPLRRQWLRGFQEHGSRERDAVRSLLHTVWTKFDC